MINSKKVLISILALVIIGVFVYYDYANFGQMTNTNNNPPTNSNVANTNSQTPTTTDTDFVPDDTNIPTTSSTVDTVDQTKLASELIANPQLYNNKQVCASGYYQESFEFTALSPTYHLDSKGDKYLDEPYIWIDFTIPSYEQINCRLTPVGQRTCFGQTTVCGIFQYAAPNQDGFGHVNAYRYQLIQADN